MGWTINTSIRIFVTEYSRDEKQILARLQPLGIGTVYHTFGYENPVIKISGVVVGVADASSLVALSTNNMAVPLNNGTALGNYYVSSVSVAQTHTIYQTLRNDLDCATPTFNFTMELLED